MKFRIILKNIWDFYYDGFRNMSTDSRKLWVIILIKLFIMFAILKVFFFPDIMKENFHSDEERIQYIEQQLIKSEDIKP